MWIDSLGAAHVAAVEPSAAVRGRLRVIARDLHKLGTCDPGDDPVRELDEWVDDELPAWIAQASRSRRFEGAVPPPATFDALLKLPRRANYGQIFDAVPAQWRLDLAHLLRSVVY